MLFIPHQTSRASLVGSISIPSTRLIYTHKFTRTYQHPHSRHVGPGLGVGLDGMKIENYSRI